MNNNICNYFFVENGFLTYKINDNHIRQYFQINGIEKSDFIIETLNKNINNISIIDIPIKNSTIFKIHDNEFIKVMYDNNKMQLYIFNLDNKCNKCNENT